MPKICVKILIIMQQSFDNDREDSAFRTINLVLLRRKAIIKTENVEDGSFIRQRQQQQHRQQRMIIGVPDMSLDVDESSRMNHRRYYVRTILRQK